VKGFPVDSPKIGIVACAKEEAPYLLEWIAYHRSLGVDSFFIADNGGNDDTTELLTALDHAGYIKRSDWIGHKAFQVKYYNSVLPQLAGVVDFAALIDVDEFLHPTDGHDSISSALTKLFGPGTSAVAVNWALYGSSGRIDPGEGLVIERFTHRAHPDFSTNCHAKAIVRPECCAMAGFNPHFVHIKRGAYLDTDGQPIRWGQLPGISQRVTWKTMRLDHFFTKSRVEFDTKRKRGRADTGEWGRGPNIFFEQDRNEVLDPVPQAFVTRTKREIERIREAIGTRPRQPERPKADTANWDTVSRNAPCPCGSGRRYKHCHGSYTLEQSL
jgi:hypothetical protein